MTRSKTQSFSGTTDTAPSQRELDNRELALLAASEGIVLLKNEGDLLPLSTSRPLALYGAGAACTIKGGTGSGDVNCRETVSIYQGMQEEGFTIVSGQWLESFEKDYEDSRLSWRREILEETGQKGMEHFFDIYSAHNYQMPFGAPILEEDLDQVDTAVYVISRTAGEASDRKAVRGDYYLSPKELEDLQVLCEHCEHLVLIINAGGPLDLCELDDYPEIESILFIGQAGMEGGRAVARILSGYYNPSGKLTDTWAFHYEDYPGSQVFSHMDGDTDTEPYIEGIYVGYRYFDSFGIKPRYAFGHGLSYTSFAIEPGGLSLEDGHISVTCLVKNKGSKGGRETLQVYAACPQTETSREWKRLAAFDKTDFLSPGESQELKIAFHPDVLVGYHEKTAAWVLEDGIYGIFVGPSSADLQVAGIVQVPETLILKRTRHICPLQKELEEWKRPDDLARAFSASWRREADRLKAPHLLLDSDSIKASLMSAGSGPIDQYVRHDIHDASEDRRDDDADLAKIRERLRTLSDQDLIALLTGEMSKWQDNAIGASGVSVPGSAGETSSLIRDLLGLDPAIMADGPAGLRLVRDYMVHKEDGTVPGQGIKDGLEGGFFADPVENPDQYDIWHQYCTAFPVGVTLAQTWNKALLKDVGRAVAGEMEEFGIRLWLAPGMNIHRNPLCGRNFEYFSEDPLLSGLMAAAITAGVQEKGRVGTTIKHFCCNNQEDNRVGYDAVISERALREIYLKGFEIAVRQAQPHAIMTSYNLVNGIHTANSCDLCTVAARQEWGFEGLIMTDWTTTSPQGGSIAWCCIAAGNDLIMPGCPEDQEDIGQALARGDLSRDQLLECAERIVKISMGNH